MCVLFLFYFIFFYILLLLQFGRAIQHLSTHSPYMSMSGENALDLDTRDVVPMVFEKLLTEPTFLKNLSKHAQSGKQMDEKLVQNVCNGGFFVSFIDNNYFEII